MSIMRVRLSRGEASKWLLQSEFVANLNRAVAESSLPVSGRALPEPRFRIQSGLPLPVGFTSRCEYVDFELVRPIVTAKFVHGLQEHLPSDVQVLWARRLPNHVPALKASIRRIRYTVNGLFEQSRASEFRNAKEWPLTQVRKNRHRVLDLKRSIPELRVEPDRLIFDIEVREEGMPKPDEFIASVFGRALQDATGFTAERTAIHLSTPVPPHKAAGNT